MEPTQNLPKPLTEPLTVPKLSDALADLLHQPADAPGMSPNAYRLAFADPEFLLRRETRGMRLQLEMLKPDLSQREQGVDHTVVVYGSARFPSPETAQASMQAAQASGHPADMKLAERHLRNARYYDQARLFGRLVAQHSEGMHGQAKLHICTGGGPGIMEAANRGAHELGAATVGLNIELPHEQCANPYVTPSLSFKFHYFALRKMHFMMRAKALVVFPGGFGTMDELFEVMTLVQTGKSKPLPIVLFGSEYWNRLFNLEVMLEEGVISPEDMDLFHLVDEAEAAWDVIKRFYAL